MFSPRQRESWRGKHMQVPVQKVNKKSETAPPEKIDAIKLSPSFKIAGSLLVNFKRGNLMKTSQSLESCRPVLRPSHGSAGLLITVIVLLAALTAAAPKKA